MRRNHTKDASVLTMDGPEFSEATDQARDLIGTIITEGSDSATVLTVAGDDQTWEQLCLIAACNEAARMLFKWAVERVATQEPDTAASILTNGDLASTRRVLEVRREIWREHLATSD